LPGRGDHGDRFSRADLRFAGPVGVDLDQRVADAEQRLGIDLPVVADEGEAPAARVPGGPADPGAPQPPLRGGQRAVEAGKDAWRIELPLTLGQAERIEQAAVSPDLLRIEGTAVQTVLMPAGDSLPSSRIDGVTESSEEEEFEGEEIVNGSIGAAWIVEEPGCEHTREGCAVTEVKSHWSHPEWDGYGGGEDNEHGDLSMTACNGEFTEICEGAFGGIFAAKEINAISPYPEGTAFFNVAEGASGVTPEMEIAAHYNEHEGGSPTVACRIPEYAYVPTPVTDGPEPTISCSQTGEGEGEEDEESEGVAYDYYMVTTIWPSGSNPPSPGP